MNEGQEDGAPAGAGPELEELRRLRLVGFLRELVRQQGPMATARLLEIDYKTLKRSLDAGRVTPHVADALEGLTEDGDDGDDDQAGQQTGQQITGLPGPEIRSGGPPAFEVAGEGDVDRPEDDVEDGDDGDDGIGGAIEEPPARGQAETENASTSGPPVTPPPVPGLTSDRTARLPRPHPQVVVTESAGDDAEVYGDAWPLVREWRRLWDGHPRRGRSLSWLATRERLLVLELALLEEHGLTLPPETEPLRGFARRGQTQWRWQALHRTRASIRKRRLLRWLRRFLTLGAWRS